MSEYLRLRQICLAAPRLTPVIDDLCAIFRVEVCHRANLVRFGLENALIPIGTDFLEVVAPTRPDTAVDRFVNRTRGHGGYMAIFQASDPRRRQAHAAALGVRTVFAEDRDTYQNTQLHPKDSRATFIEFGCSTGGDERMQTWWPAGSNWQSFVRTADTLRMSAIELEGPAPSDLARHWASIIEVPVEQLNDVEVLHVDAMDVLFRSGAEECLGAIRVQVVDPEATLHRALDCGCRLEGDSFHLAGVYFRVHG